MEKNMIKRKKKYAALKTKENIIKMNKAKKQEEGTSPSSYAEKNMKEGMLKMTAIGKKQIREQGKKLFLRNREKNRINQAASIKAAQSVANTENINEEVKLKNEIRPVYQSKRKAGMSGQLQNRRRTEKRKKHISSVLEKKSSRGILRAFKIKESKSLGKGLLKTAKGIKHAVSVLAACSGMMLAVIAVIIPLCAFMAFYGADSDDVEIDITDDTAIVAIAESQIGNKGGRPYWSWYGFNNRVDWCACFVSWCADKAGYLETGQLPRYSYCPDGINWFIQQKRWYNSNIVPKPGMIIFYDWDDDGISDHTGIVKKSEQGRVYTIEGNCRDECKAMTYPLNYSCIMGYGGIKK